MKRSEPMKSPADRENPANEFAVKKQDPPARIRIIGTAVIVGLFLCLAVSGTTRAADLTQPPADLPARPVHLPNLETRTLPNGLKIVAVQSNRVPLVTMALAVRSGSILDKPNQAGLAEAVAAEMTAGTDKYTSLQIQEQAERCGGSLDVTAGYDFSTVSASALAPAFPQMTELMADMLLHPAFPLPELGIYKNLTLQTLSVQRQRPAFLAQEELGKVLYPMHPYGVVATTPAALQEFTPDMLTDFYRAHYIPQGAVLVVVGDVAPNVVFRQIESTLGSWSSGPPTHDTLPNPFVPASASRHVYLIDRPGSVQSNIVIANPAIKRADPNYFALTVANTILGGGTDSRLFNVVREKDGYAYDVRSGTDLRALAGSFTESAQTRTAVTAAALNEMLGQAALLKTQSVTPSELDGAKNYLTGIFDIRLGTQSGLAAQILAVEAYGLPDDYVATYKGKIDAVTAADVMRVAGLYIHPEAASVIVVGDGRQLRDSLKEIGPVQEASLSP